MPRTERKMESYIHDANFKDALATYLYSLNLVYDDEHINDITVGEPDETGVRTLKYSVIQDREAELIVHS